MNLFKLTAHFGSEESCRLHFKMLRDQKGVICAKCKSTTHYWLKNKWSYECVSCKFRTSLRSGTVLQNSKLPFLIWYKTIFLISVSKINYTAKEIQKKLGLKRYEPVWVMIHKLNQVLKNGHKLHTLENLIQTSPEDFTIDCLKNGKRNIKKETKGNTILCFKASLTPANTINHSSAKNETNNEFAELNRNATHVDISDTVEVLLKENNKNTSKQFQLIIGKKKRKTIKINPTIKNRFSQEHINEFTHKLNKKHAEVRLFEKSVTSILTNL